MSHPNRDLGFPPPPLQLLCAHQEHGAVRAALTSERHSFRFVDNNEPRCERAVSFKAFFSTKVPLNLMKT